MATYTELYALATDSVLLEKISVAVAVTVETVRNESASTAYHDRRIRWASGAIRDPEGMARALIWALLAQYKDQDVATIQAATDTQIQTAVESMLPVLVDR